MHLASFPEKFPWEISFLDMNGSKKQKPRADAQRKKGEEDDDGKKKETMITCLFGLQVWVKLQLIQGVSYTKGMLVFWSSHSPISRSTGPRIQCEICDRKAAGDERTPKGRRSKSGEL